MTEDKYTRDKYIGTVCTADFKQRVRIAAATSGISVSKYILNAIKRALDKEDR